MRSIERTGRTIEEAVENALSDLGISEKEAAVEILEEPTKGFFGIIGGRDARVRVTRKQNKVELACEFIQNLLDYMGIEGEINVSEDGDVRIVEINGDDLGLLIGRHGETLRSLEFLANVVSGKGVGDVRRILVDANGYRKRREKDLEDMARNAARKVEKTGRSTALRPMDARDRRVIHMTLQRNARVVTQSQGEEPFRRVVILPREGANQGPRQR
ncbi:MAG: protein jag [Firmicutes bacterium]|nr:protein jag [Candidatus Fermentithermobacillaceae bacterium]